MRNKSKKAFKVSSKIHFGFTLTEVLLVMTILGVIATVMIGTIKPQEYKEKALKISAQKVLNEIDHAFTMIVMEDSINNSMFNVKATDGTTIGIDLAEGSSATADKFKNLVGKYITITRKTCTDTACQCYTGITGCTDTTNSSMFYLKDGACLKVNPATTNAMPTIFPEETGTAESKKMNVKGYVCFDVNDAKEPNELGKDQFIVPLGKNGIDFNLDSSTWYSE